MHTQRFRGDSVKKLAQSTIDGQSGIGVIAARPTRRSEGEGAIPIIPHLVRASGVSKGICDKITDDWHSYVKSTERGARAIDYLIYGVQSGGKTGKGTDSNEESLAAPQNSGLVGQIVGTIGFAFLGLRIPGALTRALSMGQVRKEDVGSMLKARRVAACFRYTLMSHVPHNFASQALAASLRILRKDWFQKYDADLLGVATFVKPPWVGTCFKAANFKLLGYTSGNPITYSTSHHRQGILQDDQLYILLFRYGQSNTNKPVEWKEPPRKTGILRGKYYFDDFESPTSTVRKVDNPPSQSP